MFDIGDKVVYPMHGAGVIEEIEEKEVLGKRHLYYILKIPVGDMKVMIPKEKVESTGLREIIDRENMEKVLNILCEKAQEMDYNWNQRYRNNLEKIKSGDIFQVAEVVRNLVSLDIEKGLSTGEKKMLENAKQILVSELVLVQDVGEEQAHQVLEDTLVKLT